MSNKTLIFFASLLFLFSNVNAQIKVGVKAGGNLNDNYQVGRKYYTSSPRPGFHAGAFVDYDVMPKLFARAEVLFSTRSMYLQEPVLNDRIQYEREASYIDLPISANYNVWKDLTVHAGVMPSLFVEEYKSVTTNSEGLAVEPDDQFYSYERWQFGAFVGAGYKFTVLNHNFEAGARYSMAFTRTNELIRSTRASRDPRYMMVQAYLAYTIFKF